MLCSMVVGLLALGSPAAASPAPPADAARPETGQALFQVHCATCHGTSAKGDGPMATSLRVAPADLTGLARRNRGKFDDEKVRRRIDGRDVVSSHGRSDMPVWGDAFKRESEGYSEAKVKERIEALVGYLRSLQTK